MSSNPLNSFYSCKHSALHKRQLIHLGAGNECLAMIIRARSILITPHSLKKNSGIYLLNPNCVDLIPDNKLYDMPSLFEKLISNREKVISFPLQEYWIDIGRSSEYEQANREYKKVFNV